MSSRLWTGTAISLILASFIVFAFLARRPLCIDSKLVERIDRIGTETTSSVYRCALRKAVPYDEKWAQSLGEFSRRIQAVEKLLESISPFEEHVRVTLFENRPTTFKVVNHDIFMGEELMLKPGALEKGILKIWFREKANPIILDHPILEESMTDLLDFAINGKIDIYDSVDKENLELLNSRWPFVVMTLPSYCRSHWRQIEHFQFCKDMSRSEAPARTPIVSASLRPLLTESFISSYLNLSLGERKHLLEYLPLLLQRLDFRESGVGFTSAKESQQSLVDLSSEFSGLIRNLERHSDEKTLKKWVGQVRGDLSRRGFSEQPLVAQADLLVVLKDLKGERFFSSKSWSVSAEKSVLGYDQEKMYLLPNHEGLDRNLLGSVLAQKVLFLHCGPLLVSDLEPFFEKTTRLLAIQICDFDSPIKWDSYIDGDLDKFASQNPALNFLDIHLPSLALALKLKKIQLHEKLSLVDASREILQQKFGWRSSSFDKNLNYYRVQGDIEAIQSYRP